jgi:hypothetical protein
VEVAKAMTEIEAIKTLSSSKALALRLLNNPLSDLINPDESEILIQLHDAIEEGYANNPVVLASADLHWYELLALKIRLAYHLN